MDKIKIAVIGAGAAGLMCAGTACEYGADVTVFEHKDLLALKVGITGKGRCNVTNNCTNDEFLQNVISNPRFLYTALSKFTPADTMELFEKLGVELKTERGQRVFPKSDKARDIVLALKKYAQGAKIIHTHAKGILVEDGCAKGVITQHVVYRFDRVVLATGGASYHLTGSDGSGYDIARAAGHTVTPLVPSLVPIETKGNKAQNMQGLSLKNTAMKIVDKDKKVVYEDFGELMFTHFGITGPMVLSASAHLHAKDISTLTAVLDLKPALSEKELDTRILSDFSKENNRDFANSLSALLPQKMIGTVISESGIDARKKVNSVTKEERKKLVSVLKSLEFPLLRYRPIDEAIVTSGGIETREISPKDMQSKIVKKLYFAGEVIDVDAYTGGFNLQIAFSTGHLAGESAATED